MLEQEDHAKLASWKTGLVEEVIIGKDGEIHGRKVPKAGKCKHESIKRTVQKLIPLKITSKLDLRNEKGEEGCIGSGDVRQEEGCK